VQEEDGSAGSGALGLSETRTGVVRDAVGVGLATGAYAVSFGAIASAAGLSVLQTSALSVLMFTGASQFALVGVIGGGGEPLAGIATAVLLGARNALYGLRLSGLLRVGGLRRILASHFVIDESTAMAIGRRSISAAQLGFWATGISVFVGWNTGTLLGAIGARALSSPKALGLDAAVPAAFLALVAPRLRSRETWAVALGAACVALVSVSFVPAGIPVLVAALVAVAAGLRPTRGESIAGAPGEDRR
jgi:predicted branched-subunit amino acid permease